VPGLKKISYLRYTPSLRKASSWVIDCRRITLEKVALESTGGKHQVLEPEIDEKIFANDSQFGNQEMQNNQ